MYWGKYVAHDNNRDAMGQMLALTKNVNAVQLEWNATIMHDLHEAQNYLYTSTGTGPYNESFDAITITEWWMLAENDVLQMSKRDVPGVWTYSFYDGWTPNYMFTIAHGHNAVGRFYEVASYGPQNRTLRVGATGTSREWFRPNPPLPEIAWGPRNNTNIQQSGVLFSLKYAADNASLFLDNYWTKNKRSVQRGIDGPVNAWVIPADQRRRADAVDAVNELMRQGLEIHRADDSFEAGEVEVEAGDYLVRADQPFRTLADMYLSLQQFSLENPRPYDDTGWTFQLLRNVELEEIHEVGRRTRLAARMPRTGHGRPWAEKRLRVFSRVAGIAGVPFVPAARAPVVAEGVHVYLAAEPNEGLHWVVRVVPGAHPILASVAYVVQRGIGGQTVGDADPALER